MSTDVELMNEMPSEEKVIKLVKKDTISQLKVDLDPNKRITAEQQHEQSVAIYDILDENYFALEQHDGPYCLNMRTDSRHIYFDVRDERDQPLTGFVMALGPFRRIIKDYFEVCETYYDAIRTKSPSQIQAIDMGRRALHNEGAELLISRINKYINTDQPTSRRMFTLICVMIARK